MYATFYPRPRPVDEVIRLVGLEEKRTARVLKLSGGQQRRLDVAIALVGNPELLFLDEPTTGFDPSARHEAWDVIKNLATLGMTVLLTTHYMDEAQFLADRVAVIVAGQIVAEGPPATLGDRHLAKARIRYRRPGRRDSPGRAVRHRRAGRLHRDHAGRRGPGAASAHRVGHRSRGQPRRAGGDEAVAGGRLSLAHRRPDPATAAASQPRPAKRKGRGAMNAAALTLSQMRYVNKAYWRNPASAFFAFAYPLMFLVIFTSIFRNSDVQFGAKTVNEATYYVPAMAALAVITVCFNNIAVAITFQRDSGVLKRINGTPLPSASFFGARILHAVLVSVLLVIDHGRVRARVLQRRHPHRGHPGADAGHARRRRGRVLRARVRDLVGHPERRRLTADRQRGHPAAALPVRDLHPAREQPARVDGLGRPGLPAQALPRRHAGRRSSAARSTGPTSWSSPSGGSPDSSSRSASSAGNREQADAAHSHAPPPASPPLQHRRDDGIVGARRVVFSRRPARSHRRPGRPPSSAIGLSGWTTRRCVQ